MEQRHFGQVIETLIVERANVCFSACESLDTRRQPGMKML
jgi:hypothetical protein